MKTALLIRIRRGDSRNTERPDAAGLSICNQAGQILVIGLVAAVGMVMIAISVANVGIMVAEKIRLQDSVQAAAYSAATIEARYLNLSAYINRAILANYSAMAFDTSLWSVADVYDHGPLPVISTLYIIAPVLQLIPEVGQILAEAVDLLAFGLDSTLHLFFHVTNQALATMFGQNPNFDQQDMGEFIEIYNTDLLSTYQMLLYASTQAARYKIVESVAKKMDPEIKTTTVLGLGAETVSADELREAVDWIIEDPTERESPFDELNTVANDEMFASQPTDDEAAEEEEEEEPAEGERQHYPVDRMKDEEQPVMLPALTEASLDKFSIGNDRQGLPNFIRNFNFGNFIPKALEEALEAMLSVKCLVECPIDVALNGECDCTTDVGIVLGSAMRPGEEDDFTQNRVPVIARQRLREVNFFGIDIDLDFLTDFLPFPTRMGYTSGERHADIANLDNLVDLSNFDPERALQCLIFGGRCKLNIAQMAFSELTQVGLGGAACSFNGLGGLVDDHWDDIFDQRVACGVRFFNGQQCTNDVTEYINHVCEKQSFFEGVGKYDFRTDLNNVGFPHYIYDMSKGDLRPEGSSGGDNRNALAGPSIAVVGVKNAADINGIRGLGIGADYPLTAIARAQVYYLRNPNRPDEKPSMFNPHWVARLAPIDSEDTPGLLRYGLPFVSGFGVPGNPTH